MRRVLCVWFPTFSTDLVRRRLSRQSHAGPGSDARPQPAVILLTHAVASRELVARRCLLAASSGVCEEMDLAHARSALSSGMALHVEQHRADRDAEALHALACRAIRFSPRVAADPPDGLWIDITGTERLYRGETRLIRAVATDARRLGFSVRIAAAATFGCAWAVARFSRHDFVRVPTGREEQAIRHLPVAALRVDERTILGLREIGITEISHLLNLPRPALAARFDKILLRRLRQALGDIEEHIDPVRPSPPVRVELVFDGPTDQWESIESAVRHVMTELVKKLNALERGVRRLDIELLRPRLPAALIHVNLSRPSGSVKHLWSLVRSRLEHVDLGDGVEGVVMVATRTAVLRHEQSGIPLGGRGETANPAAWSELIDTLITRFGADGVVHILLVESHLPERAFRECSAMEAAAREAAAHVRADRPTTLFPRPEPAHVISLTADPSLRSLSWRNRQWSISAATGPERLAQEWWRWEPPWEEDPEQKQKRGRRRMQAQLSPPDRDYFVIRTCCGRKLWIFRHTGTAQWFVHGEWS